MYLHTKNELSGQDFQKLEHYKQLDINTHRQMRLKHYTTPQFAGSRLMTEKLFLHTWILKDESVAKSCNKPFHSGKIIGLALFGMMCGE